MTKLLEIKGLKVSVASKDVVKGVDIEVKNGEIIAIMGPNGSGKSTLASALMGNPAYATSGSIIFDGTDITKAAPDERSRKGLFLSFQYPAEIAGVTVSNFLKTALNARRDKKDKMRMIEFMKLLNENMELLHINKSFASRYLNQGFSGGEKKKMEILQLATLEPKLAILDETDSGLDIDALRQVCEGINLVKQKHPEMAIIVITHYSRILNYLNPDKVCIMQDGRITRCGGPEIAHELEEKGYSN